MYTAETQIETERPSRYLVQLCRHANQMHQHLRHRPRRHADGAEAPEVRQVEWSETDGTVHLNCGKWTMRASANTLTVCAEASTEEDLRRIQDLVARRLEMVGRRDRLRVNWDGPDSPAGAAPMPTGKTTVRRRHLTTIAVIAAGALVFAVHLGLGGAVFASLGTQWGWAAGLAVAALLVKVIAVTAIALRRRAARRHS